MIGTTVARLRRTFPDAEVIVADDGSRDRTADVAEAAGAVVLRLPRRGKGQALSFAERAAPPGALLLCDADLSGELEPLLNGGGDLTVAAFAERVGGGFGLAKRVARGLIDVLAGIEVREPLSGQRALSAAARTACFPVAPGFGCEVRMTIDAARSGLRVREVELPLGHRATGRDLAGFIHRARQLRDTVYACGPLGLNFRGLRLPLIGWKVGVTNGPAVAAIAALGLADDLWSGPERGFRAHLLSGRTTGVLKLVGIPAVGLLATRYRRPAPSIRSSRDGDARGRGVERAGRHARLEFREAIHGTRPVGGDRRPSRPHHPRRAKVHRRLDRARPRSLVDRSAGPPQVSVARLRLAPVRETMFPSRAPFFRYRLSPRAAEIAAWAEETEGGNLTVSPAAPSLAHWTEAAQ